MQIVKIAKYKGIIYDKSDQSLFPSVVQIFTLMSRYLLQQGKSPDRTIHNNNG